MNDSHACPVSEAIFLPPKLVRAHRYAVRLIKGRFAFFIAARVQRSALIPGSECRNETATALIASVGLRIVCLDAKQIAS